LSISSCALAQHSVTRTNNFSTRVRPAPARIAVRVPAHAAQMVPGTRNPRGITHHAQNTILQSSRLKLYRRILNRNHDGVNVNFTRIGPSFGFADVTRRWYAKF